MRNRTLTCTLQCLGWHGTVFMEETNDQMMMEMMTMFLKELDEKGFLTCIVERKSEKLVRKSCLTGGESDREFSEKRELLHREGEIPFIQVTKHGSRGDQQEI